MASSLQTLSERAQPPVLTVDPARTVAVTCPVFPRRGVSSNDFPCLETLCKKIMKEKQPFERLEIRKETLLEMFKVSASAQSLPMSDLLALE